MKTGARHGTRTRCAALGLVGLVAVGCLAPTPTQLAEPPTHGEPLPGSLHLISDPALAPYPLTIHEAYAGGISGRSAEFVKAQAVVVDWTTLPRTSPEWIDLNGQACDGTFGVQAKLETDLLLILRNSVCRVWVLGTHPQGEPHITAGAEAT